MATKTAFFARAILRSCPFCGVVADARRLRRVSGGGGSAFKVGPGIDTGQQDHQSRCPHPAFCGLSPQLIGIPLTQGIEIYFKDINDNGGIGGYKLNMVAARLQVHRPTQVQGYQDIHNHV